METDLHGREASSTLLALQRMQLANAARSEALCRDLGADALQVQIVLALSTHGAMAVGRIGMLLGRPSATMTSAMDRSLARGWIKRAANPTDRRSVLLDLTEPGSVIADQVRRGYRSALLAAFATAELPSVRSVFERMSEALNGEEH